jgi:peptidoglycan/LPS O-acetylase OafA/YrhL
MSNQQSFDPVVFLPEAPRRARRIAPFVVLVGLVMYAVIVTSALTAPQSSPNQSVDRSTRVVAAADVG